MSREQRYAGFLERESHNASTPTKGEAMRQAARLLLENARENERMRKEIYSLQEALSFWLSRVPGVHSERDERIANDAGLLAGFDGDNTSRQNREKYHALGDDCDREMWEKVRAAWMREEAKEPSDG